MEREKKQVYKETVRRANYKLKNVKYLAADLLLAQMGRITDTSMEKEMKQV
jgi:hypothetical protein